MAAKMAQQQRELAEREAEKEREREKEALKAIINADKVDAGRSGEAIEVVLNQRHARETSEMIGRHYNERAAALHDALEDVLERKKEDKANAMDALRDEDATQGEIDRKLADIDRQCVAPHARTVLLSCARCPRCPVAAPLTHASRHLPPSWRRPCARHRCRPPIVAGTRRSRSA